jgi:hypothetical protein
MAQNFTSFTPIEEAEPKSPPKFLNLPPSPQLKKLSPRLLLKLRLRLNLFMGMMYGHPLLLNKLNPNVKALWKGLREHRLL